MAAKESMVPSPVNEVVKVITSRTVDEKISSLVQEKRDFPDPLSLEINEPYTDVFKPPNWCNVQEYAYGWVDPADEVQLDRALNTDHWQIVTRLNHPGARNSDFRAHGAVERRGMILVYRPLDLERRLRFLSERRHLDAVKSQAEGDRGPKWERTMEVGQDVPAPGFRPVVGELAGQPVEKAGEMVPKTSGED